jgi:hypothetical protein
VAAARFFRNSALLSAIAIGTTLLCSGCKDRLPVAPVSGRVLLGNEPLAAATITFQPVAEGDKRTSAAPGSVGRTNADGRYELRLITPDQPGAVVGKHTVRITTVTSTADDSKLPGGERVPLTWRDGTQTFVVPAEGTAAADFVIE